MIEKYIKGEIDPDKPTLVRVHSECLTGDVFGSMRCDCGDQLQKAMGKMDQEGSGVILYLRQEGRGIGLWAKAATYLLQDRDHFIHERTWAALRSLMNAGSDRAEELCAELIEIAA